MAAFETDEIRRIPLGGVRQTIHIRARRAGSPVLLFLHGGPGVPNRHGLMRDHSDLAEFFTLVAWDQRGTGGSYFGVPKQSLTLEQLLEDLRELVGYLVKTLGQEKIFLIGGSWGTELGIQFLRAHPEHIRAYVGYGQVVNGFLNEEITYDFVLNKAKEADDANALEILSRIGPPVDGCYRPVYKGLMAHRRLLAKYGGSNVAKKSLWQGTVKPLLLTREYTLRDKLGIIRGSKVTLSVLWRQIVRYDFIKEAARLAVPVYLFQGRHDFNTPSSLVEAYFAALEAPHKELVWFEHSAHSPFGEEKERFQRLLIEKLLGGEPEDYKSGDEKKQTET